MEDGWYKLTFADGDAAVVWVEDTDAGPGFFDGTVAEHVAEGCTFERVVVLFVEEYAELSKLAEGGRILREFAQGRESSQ